MKCLCILFVLDVGSDCSGGVPAADGAVPGPAGQQHHTSTHEVFFLLWQDVFQVIKTLQRKYDESSHATQ